MKRVMRKMVAYIVKTADKYLCTTYGDKAELSDGPCGRCVGLAVRGPEGSKSVPRGPGVPGMGPGKYRKKPVIVEARQFTGDNFMEIRTWAHDGMPPEANSIVLHDGTGEGLAIRTLEGTMYASNGDWIIKGVKGEFYPCKPDIFEATYEAITNDKCNVCSGTSTMCSSMDYVSDKCPGCGGGV